MAAHAAFPFPETPVLQPVNITAAVLASEVRVSSRRLRSEVDSTEYRKTLKNQEQREEGQIERGEAEAKGAHNLHFARSRMNAQ
jgi:hypothetical protein